MILVHDLVDDFVDWGKDAVRRILRLTTEYGVLCSSTKYSDGNRGCPIAYALGWEPGMSNSDAADMCELSAEFLDKENGWHPRYNHFDLDSLARLSRPDVIRACHLALKRLENA